jgi:hypothetical protein
MNAPVPALRWSGLPPYGRNKDKTENHPWARKEDPIRMPNTGIYESFPKLIVVEVSACSVLIERDWSKY